MKFVIIICAIMAGAFAGPQLTIKLSEEKRIRAEQYSNPCAEKYNIDPSILKRTTDGTLPRNEVTNKYLYCFTTSAGFVSEDGHMVVDKIASLIGDHPLVEEFKEALRKCNEITKENPLATIQAMNICLTDDTPVRLIIE